jgi:hypothetical protein
MSLIQSAKLNGLDPYAYFEGCPAAPAYAKDAARWRVSAALLEPLD